MGVGENDVGDGSGSDAKLLEHAHRRNPGGNAELSREAAAIVLHEAGVDQHIAVALSGQDEGERQVHHAVMVHAADQVDPGLVLGAGIFEDVEVPKAGCSVMVPPWPVSFRRACAQGWREPDGDDQDGALEDVLREGRRAEDVQPVEAEGDDQRADERAEDVELAVAQRRRAEEDGGEGGQQIGSRPRWSCRCRAARPAGCRSAPRRCPR